MYLMGIISGVLGIAIAIVGWNYVLIRSFGMLMLAVGTFLISASRARVRKGENNAPNHGLYTTQFERSRRFALILGAISLIASCVFFVLLMTSAQGNHRISPLLYAFFASSTILILTFGYIAGLFIVRIFSR